MAISFGDSEKKILELCKIGNEFSFQGEFFKIKESGKPTCSSGEPKTDVYIKAQKVKYSGEYIELKISYKQSNADFLENKMNAERAKQILGCDWEKIIIESTKRVKSIFQEKPLIYKKKSGKTEEGCFTLGWKFELLWTKSGHLSEKLNLTKAQVKDIYSGSNLGEDKTNSFINNYRIKDSGKANHILKGDVSSFRNIQDVINCLISIDDYIEKNPDIYFACKALNYRSYKDKYDGNRPLAVYVDWSIKNGKLFSAIIFDNPLIVKGKTVAYKLKQSLEGLKIETTKDINVQNCDHNTIIHE